MGRSTSNAVEFREILARVTEEVRQLAPHPLEGGPLISSAINTQVRQLEARIAERRISNSLGASRTSNLEMSPLELGALDHEISEMRQRLTEELASAFGIPAEQLEATGRGRQWRQEIFGTFEAERETPPAHTYGQSPMETLVEHTAQDIQRHEDQWAMYQLYDSETRREMAPSDPLDARFVRATAGYYGEIDDPPSAPPVPKRRALPKPQEETRIVSFEPGQRIIDIEG